MAEEEKKKDTGVWGSFSSKIESSGGASFAAAAVPEAAPIIEATKVVTQPQNQPVAKKEGFLDKLKKIGGKIGEHTTTKVCSQHGDVIPNAEGRCPYCNKSLTTKRGPTGYVISFGVIFALIFGLLNYAFGSFGSLINSAGFGLPVALVTAGISGIFAAVLAAKPLVKGIIYSVVIVLGLGVAVPMIAGIPLAFGTTQLGTPGGINIGCYLTKMFSGDFENINACYVIANGGGTHDTMPQYVGTKSYSPLQFNFGLTDYGYQLSAVFATQPYTLDMTLVNPNNEDNGIIFEDVKIDKIVMTKNEFAEEPGVTSCGYTDHLDSSCPIVVDTPNICSTSSPCRIKPEEETYVYTDFPPSGLTSFLGGSADDIPCRVYFQRFSTDNTGYTSYTYIRRTLSTIQFSVNLTYLQNVTHQRTLAIASSYKEMLKFKDDPDLKNEVYTIEAPSAGPIDMIVDFTTPYYIGQRGTDNKIMMEVWVANKRDGLIKPGPIRISTVGNWPTWLSLDATSSGCSREGDTVIIPQFSNIFLRLRTPLKFICRFNINTANFPMDVSYQTTKFVGEMEYRYYQETSTEPLRVELDLCT